jgi:hypothetical protein
MDSFYPTTRKWDELELDNLNKTIQLENSRILVGHDDGIKKVKTFQSIIQEVNPIIDHKASSSGSSMEHMHLPIFNISENIQIW